MSSFGFFFFLLGGPHEDSSLPKSELIVLSRLYLLVLLNHCYLLLEPLFRQWYSLFLSHFGWVVVKIMGRDVYVSLCRFFVNN